MSAKLEQLLVEAVLRHCRGVAKDNQFHAGACYCHVHAPQVGEEANLPVVVGTHERYYYHVALLTLKAVHRVDGDETAQGAQLVVTAYQLAQILHLSPVRRDHAHVDPLVERPCAPDLCIIGAQGVDGELCLLLVYASEALAHKLFLCPRERRVDPLHRLVIVEYAAVLDLRRRLHLAAVEPVARKLHDVLVHAILHAQQRHRLGVVLHDALHERLAQSAAQGGDALHRRWQLTMVACKHHTRGAAHGNPAGSLQSLCRLVDEQRPKLHAVQQPVGCSRERGGYDTRLAKQLGVDAQLQLGGTALQTFHLLVPAVRAFALRPQLAHGLAQAPQLRVVGMCLEAPLIGERQHLVVDPCGVAYAQDRDATVNELLGNPVNRHVALGTHQHLTLPLQRLVNGLHERRRLARAWRAMHHHHVFRPQHLVHRLLLCGVEPREAHGRESEMLGFHRRRVEEVAQISQAVALGTHGAVEGLEHQAVGGLVKRQLHTQRCARLLQLHRPRHVGQRHHHASPVGIAHRGGERQIADGDLFVLHGCRGGGEEHHGASKLKVVFNVVILLPHNLHTGLVERVIIASSRRHRVPRVATLHLACHACGLRLPSETLLLTGIFDLQEGFLLH